MSHSPGVLGQYGIQNFDLSAFECATLFSRRNRGSSHIMQPPPEIRRHNSGRVRVMSPSHIN